jgi:hypothetical protein
LIAKMTPHIGNSEGRSTLLFLSSHVSQETNRSSDWTCSEEVSLTTELQTSTMLPCRLQEFELREEQPCHSDTRLQIHSRQQDRIIGKQAQALGCTSDKNSSLASLRATADQRTTNGSVGATNRRTCSAMKPKPAKWASWRQSSNGHQTVGGSLT